MNLAMSVLLLIANVGEKAKKPKIVSFAELRTLAYDTVKAKDYPKKLRPTYKLEKGVLLPQIPSEFVLRAKDGPDADTEALLQLIRVARFSTYPPKGMDAKLKAMTVENAEKKIKEGLDHIRGTKLTQKKLEEYAKALAESVDGVLHEGIEAYAKKMKLKIKRPGAFYSSIRTKTDPENGTVYCITRYQKLLFELQGKDPETEVMRFVLSDTVPYAGWVYYVVTWDRGTKKVGPREILIEDVEVTFK